MPRSRAGLRPPTPWTARPAWGAAHAVAVLAVALLLASSFTGLAWSRPAARPAAAQTAGLKLPVPSGPAWVVSQGYNTSPTQGGSHYNCNAATLLDQPSGTRSCRAHYQYRWSFDLARADGNTAGQPVLSPVNGVIRWIDEAYGGMSINLENGYAYAFFHADLAPGLIENQRITVGQRLGTVSPPGGGGNGGFPHLHITLWQTTDGGNWSRNAVPFTGAYRLEGRDFPSLGDTVRNQYRTTTLYSSNTQTGGGGTVPTPTPPPAPTATPAPGGTARVTLNPTSGGAARSVAVSGSGYAANESVRLHWHSTGTTALATATANASGAFSANVTIPDATRGTHALVARGVTSGRQTQAAYAVSPTLARNPTHGAPGASVQVTVRGFNAGEGVRLNWDGTAGPVLGSATANGVGTGTVTVRVPEAAKGWHDYTGVGLASGARAWGAIMVDGAVAASPASVAVGGTVNVAVKGFPASGGVTVRWNQTAANNGSTVCTGAAGANGSYACSFRAPAGAGAFPLVATAADGTSAGTSVAVTSGAPISGGTQVGPGTFRVTGTRQGMVGGTTSSGHVITANDRFVSLPACTSASCPWLAAGVRHERWGLRVECGANCYVRVTNAANNRCSVAPVLDVGPWFTMDDYWNPANVRNVNNLPTTKNILAQGYSATDAARDRLDVGFGIGPNGYGMSNRGNYEVGNRTSIDIGDGTWADIGQPYNNLMAPNGIIVTFLWMTGESASAARTACAQGATAPTPTRTPTATPTRTPTPRPTATATPRATATPTTDTARVGLSMASAQVAQRVTVSGTGFGPNEAVRLTWNSSSGLAVGETTTDARGAFSVPITVPPVPGGNHRVVANGRSSLRKATRTLAVVASLARTPSEGPVGTLITVTARGYAVGERVRLTWDGPDGVLVGACYADASGTCTATIKIPRTSTGWHDFTGLGQTSGQRAWGAINVLAGSAPAAVQGAAAPATTQPVQPTATPPPAAPTATPAPTQAPTATPVPPTVTPPPTERTVTLVPVADASVRPPAVPADADGDGQPDPTPAADPAVLVAGGPEGALTAVTFAVEGVGAGTVLNATLVLTGTGPAGAPGGAVGALLGAGINEAALTHAELAALAVPAATDGAGAPVQIPRVDPGVEVAVDVTGTVRADGTVTFVLYGAPEAAVGVGSRESAAPPRLVVKVAG